MNSKRLLKDYLTLYFVFAIISFLTVYTFNIDHNLFIVLFKSGVMFYCLIMIDIVLCLLKPTHPEYIYDYFENKNEKIYSIEDLDNDNGYFHMEYKQIETDNGMYLMEIHNRDNRIISCKKIFIY